MPGEGHKGQRDGPVIRGGPLVKALLPQLVEPPALRTPRPGADRPPQRQRLRPPVDMAQGQIRKPAGRGLLPPDRVIPLPGAVQLPVEQAEVELSVRRGGEARQKALRLFGSG